MMDDITRPPERGKHGYVIAIRDEEDGLIFWSNEAGFGSLDTATIFTAREKALFQTPLVAGDLLWIGIPVPLQRFHAIDGVPRVCVALLTAVARTVSRFLSR